MPASGFRVVYAPNRVELGESKSVFLSGSVDVAPGVGWRTSMTSALSHLPVTVINPHRSDWDSSWREEISFAPFREQVEWEMDMLEAADVIALYFGPESKAPISLLEFGLFALSGKLVVACPPGYWKRGNVQVVCLKRGIEFVESVDELIAGVEKRLRKLGVDAGKDDARKGFCKED